MKNDEIQINHNMSYIIADAEAVMTDHSGEPGALAGFTGPDSTPVSRKTEAYEKFRRTCVKFLDINLQDIPPNPENVSGMTDSAIVNYAQSLLELIVKRNAVISDDNCDMQDCPSYVREAYDLSSNLQSLANHAVEQQQ